MHKKKKIWEEALQNKHVFKNTIRNWTQIQENCEVVE